MREDYLRHRESMSTDTQPSSHRIFESEEIIETTTIISVSSPVSLATNS